MIKNIHRNKHIIGLFVDNHMSFGKIANKLKLSRSLISGVIFRYKRSIEYKQ